MTTCGDAGCTQRHKHVDPAHLLYVGCKVIFNGDNSHLRSLLLRGNVTICEVVKVKLTDTANIVIKNCYNRKVHTVLADDVEFLELEKVVTTSEVFKVENVILDIKNKLKTLNYEIPQQQKMEMKLD